MHHTHLVKDTDTCNTHSHTHKQVYRDQRVLRVVTIKARDLRSVYTIIFTLRFCHVADTHRMPQSVGNQISRTIPGEWTMHEPRDNASMLDSFFKIKNNSNSKFNSEPGIFTNSYRKYIYTLWVPDMIYYIWTIIETRAFLAHNTYQINQY